MPVHFVFSDEAGSYKTDRGESFNKSHPFFIRSALIISGDDWPLLRDGFTGLQERYQIPASSELKWSYIGSILAHRRRGEPIPTGHPYSVFANYSNDDLIGFVREALNLLRRCDFCRIVYTVTDNTVIGRINKQNLYKMHIQDMMQRTEFALQSYDGLAIMFLDPENNVNDRCVRDAYATIYNDGDFIKRYLHIIDTLAFALSHHSFGIRLADYAAGVFNNFLRGYQESTQLFKNQVWPLLRKNPVGDPLGWGICEVPTDDNVRGRIRERLVTVALLAPGSGKQVI
jgi:hypothetical protein